MNTIQKYLIMCAISLTTFFLAAFIYSHYVFPKDKYMPKIQSTSDTVEPDESLKIYVNSDKIRLA